MGKNVTCLLEPLTFEPIRTFAVQSVTTVLKKAPSPSWAGGGVSTGVHEVNGFEKVQQVLASTRILEPIYRLSIPTRAAAHQFFLLRVVHF
jgi:hypothetical protein